MPEANTPTPRLGSTIGDCALTPPARVGAQPLMCERIPMPDAAAQIVALLHEAGETHHTVYRIVDGDDPDWASWYADWLLNLSELPDLLAARPVRSELTWLLVQLGKDYEREQPSEPWPEWYAPRMVEHFGA
jgi:hypothetical protein